MLERVLEPEVMNDRDEAMEYDSMDHSAVNRDFVHDLIAAGPLGEDCLDLGTGTALIPVELCKQNTDVRVMASDASTIMLDLARYNLEVQGLMHRVQLQVANATDLSKKTILIQSCRIHWLITCHRTNRSCPRL